LPSVLCSLPSVFSLQSSLVLLLQNGWHIQAADPERAPPGSLLQAPNDCSVGRSTPITLSRQAVFLNSKNRPDDRSVIRRPEREAGWHSPHHPSKVAPTEFGEDRRCERHSGLAGKETLPNEAVPTAPGIASNRPGALLDSVFQEWRGFASPGD